MARRRYLDPFECEINSLGPKGVGVGTAPDGNPVHVRPASPGSRVAVVAAGRRKGVWRSRRQALIRPPAEGQVPPCPQFGTCGGCQLQELQLSAQRRHKTAFALSQVQQHLGPLTDVRIHPVRGTDAAFRYRNKVELSFGPRRWVPEADHASGTPTEGSFLGFHAPGRFDRVVDASECWLVSEAMNEVLTAVRAHALQPDAPPPYDPRSHEGELRHLLLREAADGILAVVFTAHHTPAVAAWIEALAADLGERVVGLQWRTNDGLADVARGDVVRTWGRDHLVERLGPVSVKVGPESFLQTNTAGCVVLYETLAEALGANREHPGGTLLDLYCGAGSIGLFLASQFDRVVGLEEREAAVQDARANAERNGVSATFTCAKVEDALHELQAGSDVHVVVDPPRAGLHPKVARALAAQTPASLTYVACKPGSLGRDAAILRDGGWRLTDLYTVDLFPQTGHIEMIGAFTR